MLVCVLATKGADRECLEAARKWVRNHDTARSRFTLAKANERVGDLDEAEKQVRTVLERSPKDVLATLGLAAMLLKRKTETAGLAEAGRLLEKAASAVRNGEPPGEQRDLLERDLLALQGVHRALGGDVEAGKRLLRQVLKMNAEHRIAGKALEALER